jgi:hypothetical protein
MMKWARAAAAVGFLVGATGWIAGCGSDTSAEVIVRVTPTPTSAALQRAATAAPTATPVPDQA